MSAARLALSCDAGGAVGDEPDVADSALPYPVAGGGSAGSYPSVTGSVSAMIQAR